MLGTAGETGTNSPGLLHTNTPVLADQQRHIQQLCADTDSWLKEWIMIGTDVKRESRESMLSAQIDDGERACYDAKATYF